MLREMLGRLTRIVIVGPAMLIVVMAYPFQVVYFVRNVEHFLEHRRTTLHSKTVQRE